MFALSEYVMKYCKVCYAIFVIQQLLLKFTSTPIKMGRKLEYGIRIWASHCTVLLNILCVVEFSNVMSLSFLALCRVMVLQNNIHSSVFMPRFLT